MSSTFPHPTPCPTFSWAKRQTSVWLTTIHRNIQPHLCICVIPPTNISSQNTAKEYPCFFCFFLLSCYETQQLIWGTLMYLCDMWCRVALTERDKQTSALQSVIKWFTATQRLFTGRTNALFDMFGPHSPMKKSCFFYFNTSLNVEVDIFHHSELTSFLSFESPLNFPIILEP